jgi:hypothetical protein
MDTIVKLKGNIKVCGKKALFAEEWGYSEKLR